MPEERETMEEVAVRVEGATLDHEQELIHAAFRLIYPRAKVTRVAGFEYIGDGIGPYTDEHRAWQVLDARMTKLLCAGGFLDAAVSLVPEGLSVALYIHPSESHADIYRIHPSKGLVAEAEQAATPALAIVAASLRARALTPRATEGEMSND